MVEKELNFFEQIIDFFVKIFIPSFIAISIKIATQMRNEKFNLARIILSYIIGIGCGYFVYSFIGFGLKESFVPIVVGLVAISGEKIANYLIYKLNFDSFLSSIFEAFKQFLIKLISGK